MPVTDLCDGDWQGARRTVLAQHRTLRLIIDSARGVAQSLLQGDELGVVVLPYLIVGLDRALDCHLTQEEALVCPLLELDLPAGRMMAETLRSNHARVRLEMARLEQAGAQQAVTIARRLQALTTTVLQGMAEEEQTLWPERPPVTTLPMLA